MSWYRTGTISLTNGSKSVTGSGTLFVSNVKSGFALVAPDFSVYEVDNVSSDTTFTLKENYRGTTVSSGTYAIFQTQGIIKDLTDQVTALINTFGPLRDAYTNGEIATTALTSTFEPVRDAYNNGEIATTTYVRSLLGPSFSVYKSSAQSTGMNANTKITFQTVDYSTDSAFSTTTSRFTPTKAGYYQIQAGVQLDVQGGTVLSLYKNGSPYKNIQYTTNGGIIFGGAQVYLNGTGDFLELYVSNSIGGNILSPSANTYFQGSLIRIV